MPMSHIGTDVNCMPIILLLFLVRITDETMPGGKDKTPQYIYRTDFTVHI